jgi:hypothetical protein
MLAAFERITPQHREDERLADHGATMARREITTLRCIRALRPAVS